MACGYNSSSEHCAKTGSSRRGSSKKFPCISEGGDGKNRSLVWRINSRSASHAVARYCDRKSRSSLRTRGKCGLVRNHHRRLQLLERESALAEFTVEVLSGNVAASVASIPPARHVFGRAKSEKKSGSRASVSSVQRSMCCSNQAVSCGKSTSVLRTNPCNREA